MSDWLLRTIGFLLLLISLSVAMTRAPERPVLSLVPRWAPAPSDFIELQGQLVHMRDEGPRTDPNPIVLLHGTASSLHTWEGWAHALRGTRRVITVDLPGFGLTGPNANADYSIANYVRFVLALLDELKLQRVVIGGNSLGGEIAWQFAAAAPQRVAALVLVDASGYAVEPESTPLGFQLAMLPGARYLLKGILPRTLVRQGVESAYSNPLKVNDDLVDRYFELCTREGNREALIDRLAQAQLGTQAALISQLKLPTLILWGGRDRLIPPSAAQRFAADIAGSQLHVFEKLGHVPQEEDPAATVAVLNDFLSTHH